MEPGLSSLSEIGVLWNGGHPAYLAVFSLPLLGAGSMGANLVEGLICKSVCSFVLVARNVGYAVGLICRK